MSAQEFSQYVILKPSFHAAPDTLQHNQPIVAKDFVAYCEWSYGEYNGRFPRNDKDADVLVGDAQIRYRNWYISGGRGFHVSNGVTIDDPDHVEKFLKLNMNEILRFVSKTSE